VGLELSDTTKRLRVVYDLWADLTDEQRRKVHNTFLRFRPKVGVIESTDGYLTVLAKKKKKKKTLPDKAVRNCKTTTNNKRPKL